MEYNNILRSISTTLPINKKATFQPNYQNSYLTDVPEITEMNESPKIKEVKRSSPVKIKQTKQKTTKQESKQLVQTEKVIPESTKATLNIKLALELINNDDIIKNIKNYTLDNLKSLSVMLGLKKSGAKTELASNIMAKIKN